MQKLFFSDVDNTLVVKGQEFSENLKSVLKLVQESGDEFVFCSGRPLANLISIGQQMRKEGIMLNYVSGFNGATIYDLQNQELIYENGLMQADVQKITKILEKENLDYLLYGPDSIYASNPKNEWAVWESELTNLPLEKLGTIFASTKILGLVDPEQMEVKLKELQAVLIDFEVCNSTPFFIEITKKKVNKGTGLQQMQRHLKIKDENCFAFGDAMNDYEMFVVCKNSLAVENACDEIKELSQMVLGPVVSDGVANYLKKLYN